MKTKILSSIFIFYTMFGAESPTSIAKDPGFKYQVKNQELKDFISWKKNLKFENHLSVLNNYYKYYDYPKINNFIEELKINKW